MLQLQQPDELKIRKKEKNDDDIISQLTFRTTTHPTCQQLDWHTLEMHYRCHEINYSAQKASLEL